MGKINTALKLGNRERMIRACLNQDVDRLPYWFMFGPWKETAQRWRDEGLADRDWREYFGLDSGFVQLKVNLGYCPAFERRELERSDRTVIFVDALGIVQEAIIGHSTIPKYLEYPVKNRAGWEALKKRLDPDAPGRFAPDWGRQVERLRESDAAVQIGGFPQGLFGSLRDMMGVEELLVAFYDDPGMIHEMMETLTDLWLAVYERAARDIQIDHIHIWEDMSGKQGPLISPAMFREFMLPNYRRIVAFARRQGIAVVSVDTDGNMDIMMELLAEAGINLALPFEVQAGCDVVAYRKKYPQVAVHGGIDKRALALGFAEIDAELERLDEVFCASGYIPGLDHLVPPDISLENMAYFCGRLRERLGMPAVAFT